MQDEGIILIGGGGHAAVVLEACLARERAVVGVVDDDPDCRLAKAGLTWLGPIDRLGARSGAFVIGLGDLASRRAVLDQIEGMPSLRPAPPVIHPSAVVSPACELSPGVVVLAGVVVNANARIGGHAILNTRCVVEHDCLVGENTHLAPASVLGGGCRVGNDTLMGIQSCAIPGVTIGSGCVVGAGAVVIDALQDGTRAVGVPARTMCRSGAGGL